MYITYVLLNIPRHGHGSFVVGKNIAATKKIYDEIILKH